MPPDFLEALLFLSLCVSILLFLRFFGKAGLYAYAAIAILIGNLQVLKATQFSFYGLPIALGTTTFASLFCVSDILTEYYGKQAAVRSIWIGFSSTLMTTVAMTLTLAMRPLDPSTSSDAAHFFQNHEALTRLFMPAPAILLSSLIAYTVSQYTDIIVFQVIKRMTHQRWLWLRTAVSSFLSALLDNTIFSVCAWVIFAHHPVSSETLLHTYILGGLIFRLVAALAFTPLLYVSKYFLPKSNP